MIPSLLAIDAGNTSTHVGYFDSGELVTGFRFATDRTDSSDTLALTIIGLLRLNGIEPERTGGVALCSVVPVLSARYVEMSERYLGRDPLFITAANAGLPVSYAPPSAVGADRLANAVEAVATHGAPVIIADFGTATTVDAVDASGTYAGGAIAPGVEIGLQSLHSRTAQLPMVELREPEQTIGGSTAESLRSGLVYGMAELADGLIRRFRLALGAPALAIATGGIAPLLASACTEIGCVEPDLTLRGIRRIWEREAGVGRAEV
jgi:type III pantothenate kinase